MTIINSILTILAKQHKCVLLNINEFTLILKDWSGIDFQPITYRAVLKTGFYATVNGMKVFVSYLVAPSSLRTSDLENPSPKNENDWTPEVSFEDFVKTNQHLIILL